MQQAEHKADPGSRADAQPCRAAQACYGVSGHRAGNQNAFQPQVDPAAFLGQAFAQADEQKRRTDADRASQQCQQKGTQVDISHVAALLSRQPCSMPSA